MLTFPHKQIDLLPGSCAMLYDLTWQDYENFLNSNPNRRYRATYYQGTLEIVVPLPENERPNRLIADIVKELLDYQGKEWDDFGSTTFRKKTKDAGVEPDSSFYIQNVTAVAPCRRINLENFPSPNLVIESDLTSPTTIEAYTALAVPEVWLYHNSQFRILLYGNDRYFESDTSPQFSGIDVKSIVLKLTSQIFTGIPSSKLRQQLRQQLQELS